MMRRPLASTSIVESVLAVSMAGDLAALHRGKEPEAIGAAGEEGDGGQLVRKQCPCSAAPNTPATS